MGPDRRAARRWISSTVSMMSIGGIVALSSAATVSVSSRSRGVPRRRSTGARPISLPAPCAPAAHPDGRGLATMRRGRPGPRSSRVPPGQDSVAGPEALMICWNATGGSVLEQVPPDLAAMARMLSW